jgi:hypothetical protein
MDRRKALAIAGTAAATLVAAGGALAANFGLLSTAANADPVGQLPAKAGQTSPATTGAQPSVTVVYEDVYVDGPVSGPNAGTDDDATESSAEGVAPQTQSPQSTRSDDDDDDETDRSEPADDRSSESQSTESEHESDD